MPSQTIALIIGNRGFFPAHLCAEARSVMGASLRRRGVRVVCLSPEETAHGAVTTWGDAKRCAAKLAARRDTIDGIIVTLPNFGDERSVADAIRLSGLSVPVLLHAWPDELQQMGIGHRRDSFCGKISVANALAQYGIPYSLTSRHTVHPESSEFEQDLDRFLAVCRIVRGIRHARLGAVGARPAAFATVRFSEKIFENAGVSVETLDLSELFASAEKVSARDAAAGAVRITSYLRCPDIPKNALLKMARLHAALVRWIAEHDLSGVAIQCWTSMEENFGIVPCAVMSMLSEDGIPAACEVDVAGCLSMLVLQCASGSPSALLDWNNNYGADDNKAVLFHCSNLPKSFFASCRMEAQEIIAATVGRDNACGTVAGRIKSGPFTFLRLTTDDARGTVAGYAGEGSFTDDSLETFGGYGVAEIPELQILVRRICRGGFEHHVAVNLSRTAEAVREALETYFGWDLLLHNPQERSHNED